jgi:hypothetical protein
MDRNDALVKLVDAALSGQASSGDAVFGAVVSTMLAG